MFDPLSLETRIQLRPDAFTLFESIRDGRTTTRGELSPRELPLVDALIANHLVLECERPPQTSKNVVGFALSSDTIVPGVVTPGLYSYGAVARRLRLDEPLPERVRRAFDGCDARGDRLVALRSPLRSAKQWNPYTGHAYLETNPPQLDVDQHRWLEARWDALVRQLLQMLHEAAHQHVASLGLKGLLGASYPSELTAFHAFSEWVAGIVTDVEVGPDLTQTIKNRWPPAAHRSHVVAGQLRAALEATGLTTPQARGEFVYRVWRDGVVPEHRRPGKEHDAVLSNYLLEEWSYAKKVEVAERAWQRSYWFSNEIREAIELFAPARPVKVETRSRGIIVLSGVGDLEREWVAVLLDSMPETEARQTATRASLALQQYALKLAELRRAVRSPRLLIESSRAQALALRVDREWARLRMLAARGLHEDLPAEAAPELETVVASSRATLARDLRDLSGSSSWSFSHPLLEEDGMLKEGVSHLDLVALTPGSLGRPEAVAHAVDVVLDEIDAYLDGGDDETVEATQSTAFAHRQRLARASSTSNVDAARAWLLSLRSERALKLRYEIDWLSLRPFVEPLDGFRIT
ncbi:MAG: hypothetical protein JST00_27890 [Deltaproteobacteria bacterium]|nr:hypothetical protein [Deltaproteobacteria bacterium]